MIRSLTLSSLSVFALLAVFAASPVHAEDKAAPKKPAMIVKEPEPVKPLVPAVAPVVAPVVPAVAPVAEAPKPAENTPDSYKAGNLEISSISANAKGDVTEIYFKVKNNGKFDDAITGAELVGSTGEIVTVARITTQEISNQAEIKQAQDETRKIMQEARNAPHPKDGEKPATPKVPSVPKPEYKDITKDVEGAAIVLPADKTTKLDSDEARLKLTGLKTQLKQGDLMPVLVHFRSSPNATIKVKVQNKTSLLDKLFGR